MLKLEMMLCVMMLPLVVVGCTSKQSVSQCVKQLPPPAWIMQPPRLADTAERNYFTLREADHYAKTTGRNPEDINEQQIELPISMAPMQLLWAIHTRFQRSINALCNKTEQSIYECLLGFVLTTFSAPPQILAASTVFFCPIVKRRNDGWCFSLVLLLPVCFEQ